MAKMQSREALAIRKQIKRLIDRTPHIDTIGQQYPFTNIQRDVGHRVMVTEANVLEGAHDRRL